MRDNPVDLARLDILPRLYPAGESEYRIGVREAELNRQQHDQIWVKSHAYLRTAMVALLLGLGAAVFWQTWRQDFEILGSVSAYYYTPAQAIFVGALIGLGASMVALKGTRPEEDALLNLGGVFAALVAIVPTSRGEDHETAVAACEQGAGPLLTEQATTGPDCPTIRALEEATRANVENNLGALLVVGALALLATVLFALRDRRADHRSESKFWAGFGFVAALAVWLAGLAASLWFIDWFIEYAHYLAAVGLLLCIFFVAVSNARRYRDEQPRGIHREAGAVSALARYRYTVIAWIMVVVVPVGVVLVLTGNLPLFWLEIVAAALFAAFWTVQTIEQLPRETSL